MKKETYIVEGMSCQGCARAVTNVINDLSGVQSATIDLANKSAVVAYDETATNFEAIHSAVAEAGYSLSK